MNRERECNAAPPPAVSDLKYASSFVNIALPRRRFLTSALGGLLAAGMPAWAVREAEANADAQVSVNRRRIGANDMIQVGVIGPGGSKGGYRQGRGVAQRMAGKPGVKVVAVCDVDDQHLEEAADTFGPGTAKFHDFRELLARPDTDAVVIGAPDHWHAVMSVLAMRAGKDVYCEKPMTLTIDEGRKMVDAARKYNAVFQCGSQQRSNPVQFRTACELVRNGRLGKITRVEAHIPGAPRGGPFAPQAVPAGFDWDLWQGPAPKAEYLKERTHGSFRYWYEYAGGMTTDWGAHHLDIAQWGLGRDNSGPAQVQVLRAEAPPPDPQNRSYNVHTSFDILYAYDDGTPLILTTRGENGVRFEGENGKWIFVSREKIAASDPVILTEPLPASATRLYASDSHEGNFVDCVRSRQTPICDVAIGHRSASVCHLGNIALRLNRPLVWNPDKQEFKNDKEANAMRSRPHRAPWAI